MQQQIKQILREHDLHTTAGRRMVLTLFLNANSALVHAEIEKELHAFLDRVTIYRTLQVFSTRGIIHSIPTTDGSIKYSLTKENLKHKGVSASHPHFYCSNCNKTVCLYDVRVPQIKVPKTHKAIFHELVVTGICNGCQ